MEELIGLRLVGLRLGPGPWLELTPTRLGDLALSLGAPLPEPLPPLYVLGFLPALTRELALPVKEPTSLINYGLDRVEGATPLVPGNRVRARLVEVVEAEWIREPEQLQVKRLVEVENQNNEMVLTAVTLSRLNFSG